MKAMQVESKFHFKLFHFKMFHFILLSFRPGELAVVPTIQDETTPAPGEEVKAVSSVWLLEKADSEFQRNSGLADRAPNMSWK